MFRSMIDQLEDLNQKMEGVSAVKDDGEDAEERPLPKVVSSRHIDLVKRTAAKYNWNLVELEELFCQGNQLFFIA